MKQIASWIFLPIVIVVGASVGVWAMLADGSIDFPDPTPPPERPPDVHLMRPGSSDERQQAILVLSQWTVDGEIVTNSLTDVPIERPAALHTYGSDTVLIRIATKSAPLQLGVTHYDQLKPNGHHAGDPLRLMAWQHPKALAHHHHAAENARLIRYVAAGDLPGWEFAVRLPQTGGESIIVLWGQWFMPRQGGVYSANWTMSARR